MILKMQKTSCTWGLKRKSMVIREEERRATAYHEAGHAIVAEILPGHRPCT